MSDPHQSNKSLGNEPSNASELLNNLQGRRTGKLPEKSSGFSGIANSTRSLFRSILGNGVTNGTTSNANLANLLSNKPGNSTSVNRDTSGPLEGSSQWAEAINNTSHPVASGGSSTQSNFNTIIQREVTIPSLEDELNRFTDVGTSSNSGEGNEFESIHENTLDISLASELPNFSVHSENSIGARFPLNRFSLKSAPHVGLCVNSTEPSLITSDKNTSLIAEKRAYAWADEFLSQFSESSGESHTTESIGKHRDAPNLNEDTSSAQGEQYLNESLDIQRNIDDKPSNSNAHISLESMIQSPDFSTSELTVPLQDDMALEETWRQTDYNDGIDAGSSLTREDPLRDYSEYSDGADIVALLNGGSFPAELLPTPFDISVVEQSPTQANNVHNDSEWIAEFNQEDKGRQVDLLTEAEGQEAVDSWAWTSEFERQLSTEPEMPLFETSEVNDGADVISFLNSTEFPEELSVQLDEASNFANAWHDSTTDQENNFDWSSEFNCDQNVPTNESWDDTELESASDKVFDEAQAQFISKQSGVLHSGNSKDLYLDNSEVVDGGDVIAFLNSEHFPDSLIPSEDALLSEGMSEFETELEKDTTAGWLAEFNHAHADIEESDGNDVVAFLNSSDFPKELTSNPEDMADMERAWNSSLEADWSTEFTNADTEDDAINDKSIGSPRSLDKWLKEFNGSETEDDFLKPAIASNRSTDVNTYFGDGYFNYIKEEDTGLIVDGAEVVEFLSAGAFPLELTPDITDLDEVSEMEVKVVESWFNEFQKYDPDSQNLVRDIAGDNSDLTEDEMNLQWDHQFLRPPYLDEDLISELSESRPPTPPDGFEVVAFLNHSDFPTELTTKTPVLSTHDSVKIHSFTEDQVNQSHLQRWLDEFEDGQDGTKENPIAGWVSEFSEIQDLIRQEIDQIDNIDNEELSFDTYHEYTSVFSPRNHGFSMYHGSSGQTQAALDSFDSWTRDFLQAEFENKITGDNEGIYSESSPLSVQRSDNLDGTSDHIYMLDKKGSIGSTIKDLIQEIANEISAEDFLYNFDYQEESNNKPITTHPTVQTYASGDIRYEFTEKVGFNSEVTKKNALDRLQQLRKHILG
ncbi:hypothetical protein K493DRAFT_332895 [Basidiobolus meristosporus CBS 931.73]|uniref:Uncharacterized protein n=1 Tax=Basidiobolus meristosporus CBS 931.73 TaxID=1314790 RepID=A0A1Y1ZA30_9FUNG|nr:hypothetical protein K493DRAFT_332895 [Basidiobolus meristosporus CBS 931.73]|eukprot:ORY07122.1 hypothetical protein K493DRAFT_332895 [Basidiobolus meristosporus CBS 931.73]